METQPTVKALPFYEHVELGNARPVIEIDKIGEAMERLIRAADKVAAVTTAQAAAIEIYDPQLKQAHREFSLALTTTERLLNANGGPTEIDSIFADIMSARLTSNKFRQEASRVKVHAGAAHIGASETSVFVVAAKGTFENLRRIYPSQIDRPLASAKRDVKLE